MNKFSRKKKTGYLLFQGRDYYMLNRSKDCGIVTKINPVGVVKGENGLCQIRSSI